MSGQTASGIHYDSWGEGDTVLCIAGLGGHASFWRAAAERLSAGSAIGSPTGSAPRFRVLAFDHPGIGASAKTADQRIATIAQAALDVLDRHDVSAAHVIGHSTGSLVAQALALDHRARCTTLVLSGGWAKPDRRFRDLFALRHWLLDRLGTQVHGAFARLSGYDPQWYERHVAGEPLRFDGDDAFDIPTMLRRIEMLVEYQRADELATLDIDTLVIGARDDFIVPFYLSEDLATRIPGAALSEMTGGHFFPQVDPGAFAARVAAFLNGGSAS